MSTEPKPYRLCGCIHVATETEALTLQDFLREILGGGGFRVEHVEQRADGAEIVRVVSP